MMRNFYRKNTFGKVSLSSVPPSCPETSMKLQELPEDVIRSIFSFCDIYAVISMSRTNKSLRRLTLEKLVWADLVENLRRRGFVDQLSLSDIRSYSQRELVALVKGLLTGPASWNPAVKPKARWFRSSSSYRPAPTPLETSIQYAIHPPGIVASKENEARLLDGGEYVLFNNATLECWSVRHDKLIWAYDIHGPGSFVIAFAAEVLDGGHSVNIVVCEQSWFVLGNDQSTVRVMKLDFDTGSSKTLFSNELADVTSYGFTDARICGDIACAVLQHWQNGLDFPDNYCMLINWKTNSQLKLTSALSASPFLVTLIPNHVLFLTKDASGSPTVDVINNSAALFSHWRHVNDPILETVYTSQLTAVVSEHITLSTPGSLRRPWKRELCAHESPLEEGTYRVWVSLSGYSPSSSKQRAVIYSYHLSLPKKEGEKLVWRPRTTSATIPNRTGNSSGISYSGHTARYSVGHSIVGPSDPRHVVAVLTGLSIHTRLSTYSGALTSLANNTLLVSYYK
ncbi:hypothetical protein DFH06DRAFT_264432 [Mycena polygramma]|nr:hypothetical protein DFH06DRAFT_264432 [Mycena polygramma]